MYLLFLFDNLRLIVSVRGSTCADKSLTATCIGLMPFAVFYGRVMLV